MITQALRTEYQFQRQHGGGWVGHDAEQAINGARAYLILQEAIDEGLADVTWQDDDFPDTSWMDERQLKRLEHEQDFLLQCTLSVQGEVVQTLCGVHVGPRGAGDPYCHIIESELALEALDALTDALSGVEDVTDVAY